MKPKLKAIDLIVRQFDRLATRWEDEQEYEDFAGYRSVMTKAIEERGGTEVQLTPSPFECTFMMAGLRHRLRVAHSKILLEVSVKPRTH